jgi:serine/threonine protein kinase
LEYVAPEVIQFGSSAYSPAADWWGLGVLIYELLLGLVPWDGSNADQIMEQIKVADVVWPPQGMVSWLSLHYLRGRPGKHQKPRRGTCFMYMQQTPTPCLQQVFCRTTAKACPKFLCNDQRVCAASLSIDRVTLCCAVLCCAA